MLKAFASWFSSPAGIWQTIGLIALVVLYEKLFPNSDPNGFWLLYWLTVYSAVTQPILAYVAGVSGAEELKLIKEELQILKEMQNK